MKAIIARVFAFAKALGYPELDVARDERTPIPRFLRQTAPV